MTNDLTRQMDELTKPLPDVAGDFERRGTKMTENDSLDRVIEGGKLASDGARNLATYFHREQWDMLADIFDQVRVNCARLGGRNVAADEVASQRKLSGEALTRNDAYDRVYRGLSMMAAGCYQIAGGHRGDMRWSKIAYMTLAMRDQAGNLIRMKKQGRIFRPN